MKRNALSNGTAHRRLAVGALAGAAANGALVMDLGREHNLGELTAVKRGAASTGETLLIQQAHDGEAQSPTWVTCPAAAGGALAESPASAAAMVLSARPTARWVRVLFTNGSVAQTALSLELTAYPA